jgi:hypothetical protein
MSHVQASGSALWWGCNRKEKDMSEIDTSAVKLFDPVGLDDRGCGPGAYMEQDQEWGEYVEHEDYLKLAAERDALKAENERLREAIKGATYAEHDGRVYNSFMEDVDLSEYFPIIKEVHAAPQKEAE